MRRILALALMAGGLVLMATGCATVRPPSRTPQVERTLLTTGYCPCRVCCGWERNWLGRPVYSGGPLKGRRKAVGVTANGATARRGTVAADTSRYPFGTVMRIPGYGYGRVEDRGGDIEGDHIDLFFPSHREALEWGRRYRRVGIWFR
jgi:3D (Asp-Asp-Asp) domain-containing protein